VVSRLVERKGIGNVIEAVAELPGVELVIAGGPPASLLADDPEAMRFARLAESLGLGDRFELLGAVERTDVPALLRSADVVACCPWYEPFGMVAVEAMACGVPVVATNVGGLAESVIQGETGLLVNPRSPDDIASAIWSLLQDRRSAKRMGRTAAALSARYSWKNVAAQTLLAAERTMNRRTSTVKPGQ
jgi:D-inositol-3-phosphate glycosyltransferase